MDHSTSINNFVSDLLTRWAASENQNNNIARCSGGFELDDAQFPNKEPFYSVFDSIEQLSIQPDDVAEISEVDFTNFNDSFKYEETIILNIRRVNTRSGRDKHLQPKEASVYSTKPDLVDYLQGEYISYLSRFIRKERRKYLRWMISLGHKIKWTLSSNKNVKLKNHYIIFKTS
eukprot:snap_masked-scaffold_11-processed-gene-5.26-mRNA-1 protein AED:1.00 eAED:1.00 QI:0/0/0/0/1/1/2/0/173